MKVQSLFKSGKTAAKPATKAAPAKKSSGAKKTGGWTGSDSGNVNLDKWSVRKRDAWEKFVNWPPHAHHIFLLSIPGMALTASCSCPVVSWTALKCLLT